jgi:hypothetical protein
VNKFHGRLQKGFFYKIKTIQGNGRSLSALTPENPGAALRFGNKKQLFHNH